MEDKTLKNLNLHIMETHDANIISGGSLIEFATSVFKKVTPVAFGIFVIENWEEVKQGISDGWNVK